MDEYRYYEMLEKLSEVLEVCYSDWFQNKEREDHGTCWVLEVCHSDWFQNV
ncbi:hypothetical protein [Listeria aquatica]|uniref:hypothetical protein n=1 Tax=Listeria aquatica TaxID=1494960 RepID=UPI003D06236C